MDVRRAHAVGAFLALAGEFLDAREAEHNLILGICSSLQADPRFYLAPPYFAVVLDDERVVAAAIRTPPHDLVLSESDAPGAVEALLDDVKDGALPGVLGPVSLAAAFAHGWAQRTGSSARLVVRERAFRLARVIPPRRARGRMRAAEASDRPVIVDWFRAFIEEALADESWDVDAMADRWLSGRNRTLQLWVDDDRIVSLAGVGGRTPNGVRIGPVYTPPEHRGVGYASNLVAAASQAELDAGRSFLFLITDLANPTSNHIYQAIGFERVTDIDRYAFG